MQKNETFWPTNIRVGLLAETRFYNGSGTQMNPYTEDTTKGDHRQCIYTMIRKYAIIIDAYRTAI